MFVNWKIILLAAFVCTGCGTDITTSNKESPGIGSCTSPINSLSGSLTSGVKKWGTQFNWDVGPSMGGIDLVENQMTLIFKTYNGKTPDTLTEVVVTAWMPEHKHGTGNQVPRTEFGQRGEAKIKNIWFSMTGLWELIIKATVNDAADELRFCVNVGE
jgi:hypothetical protein